MPKPDPFDLSKALSDVAIEWNYLELTYHQLIHVYMMGMSADVAAAVLNAMSATSKAEFFEFLIAKHETHKGILGHLDHFQKMMRIVTENRNIIQHSLPTIYPMHFEYEGMIFKRNKLGKPVFYKASVDDFFQIIDDLKETSSYAQFLVELCRFPRKKARQKLLNDYVAHTEKPSMPHKLVPSPIGPTPKA